jgi:chromosome segregation ATPase
MRESPMGYLDRLYDRPTEQPSSTSGVTETVVHFPGTTKGYGAVLDLVNKAAEVIKDIENQASEAKRTSSLAEKRIAELEAEVQLAQKCIREARHKLKESDEAAKGDRARLEAAERKLCELERRARTAEANAKENANALARIEEAIRTKLLENRLPADKLTLAAEQLEISK